ncbi:hypothetical protein V1478_008782 [Vespula squamosa]|uniref:Uncharacterized protein n=1 Tax=Vespula squamosa TaxID=30214 RepID=A0ABD2AUI2_VESSQ
MNQSNDATLLGSSQRVSQLKRRKPHTVEAHGYKSSRSIQFQPVTDAEKSCREYCNQKANEKALLMTFYEINMTHRELFL